MATASEAPVAVGLLLAAGGGRRMGTPKALLRTDAGESWLGRGCDALLEAGCSPVVVVLGAAHDEAAQLLDEEGFGTEVQVVVAQAWAQGIGESLRAGLEHLVARSHREVQAALVMLVDLPDVGAAVLARVSAVWAAAPSPSAALVRATYDGAPGHPVVLGRDHWPDLVGSLHGDVGAQRYLSRVDVRRRVEGVECADLATGHDIDRPLGGSR